MHFAEYLHQEDSHLPGSRHTNSIASALCTNGKCETRLPKGASTGEQSSSSGEIAVAAQVLQYVQQNVDMESSTNEGTVQERFELKGDGLNRSRLQGGVSKGVMWILHTFSRLRTAALAVQGAMGGIAPATHSRFQPTVNNHPGTNDLAVQDPIGNIASTTHAHYQSTADSNTNNIHQDGIDGHDIAYRGQRLSQSMTGSLNFPKTTNRVSEKDINSTLLNSNYKIRSVSARNSPTNNQLDYQKIKSIMTSLDFDTTGFFFWINQIFAKDSSASQEKFEITFGKVEEFSNTLLLQALRKRSSSRIWVIENKNFPYLQSYSYIKKLLNSCAQEVAFCNKNHLKSDDISIPYFYDETKRHPTTMKVMVKNHRTFIKSDGTYKENVTEYVLLIYPVLYGAQRNDAVKGNHLATLNGYLIILEDPTTISKDMQTISITQTTASVSGELLQTNGKLDNNIKPSIAKNNIFIKNPDFDQNSIMNNEETIEGEITGEGDLSVESDVMGKQKKKTSNRKPNVRSKGPEGDIPEAPTKDEISKMSEKNTHQSEGSKWQPKAENPIPAGGGGSGILGKIVGTIGTVASGIATVVGTGGAAIGIAGGVGGKVGIAAGGVAGGVKGKVGIAAGGVAGGVLVGGIAANAGNRDSNSEKPVTLSAPNADNNGDRGSSQQRPVDTSHQGADIGNNASSSPGKTVQTSQGSNIDSSGQSNTLEQAQKGPAESVHSRAVVVSNKFLETPKRASQDPNASVVSPRIDVVGRKQPPKELAESVHSRVVVAPNKLSEISQITLQDVISTRGGKIPETMGGSNQPGSVNDKKTIISQIHDGAAPFASGKGQSASGTSGKTNPKLAPRTPGEAVRMPENRLLRLPINFSTDEKHQSAQNYERLLRSFLRRNNENIKFRQIVAFDDKPGDRNEGGTIFLTHDSRDATETAKFYVAKVYGYVVPVRAVPLTGYGVKYEMYNLDRQDDEGTQISTVDKHKVYWDAFERIGADFSIEEKENGRTWEVSEYTEYTVRNSLSKIEQALSMTQERAVKLLAEYEFPKDWILEKKFIDDIEKEKIIPAWATFFKKGRPRISENLSTIYADKKLAVPAEIFIADLLNYGPMIRPPTAGGFEELTWSQQESKFVSIPAVYYTPGRIEEGVDHYWTDTVSSATAFAIFIDPKNNIPRIFINGHGSQHVGITPEVVMGNPVFAGTITPKRDNNGQHYYVIQNTSGHYQPSLNKEFLGSLFKHLVTEDGISRIQFKERDFPKNPSPKNTRLNYLSSPSEYINLYNSFDSKFQKMSEDQKKWYLVNYFKKHNLWKPLKTQRSNSLFVKKLMEWEEAEHDKALKHSQILVESHH